MFQITALGKHVSSREQILEHLTTNSLGDLEIFHKALNLVNYLIRSQGDHNFEVIFPLSTQHYSFWCRDSVISIDRVPTSSCPSDEIQAISVDGIIEIMLLPKRTWKR